MLPKGRDFEITKGATYEKITKNFIPVFYFFCHFDFNSKGFG